MPASFPRFLLLFLGTLLAMLQSTRLPAAAPSPLGPLQGHVFSAPAVTAYCRINPNGVTVSPNGRVLTPRGRQIVVEPHPYGMALSADGKTLITINSGTAPLSFSIVQDPLSSEPIASAIPEGVATDEGILRACFMGVVIPDQPPDTFFYAAGGDDGTVMVWDHISRQRVHTVSLDIEFRGRPWQDSYTGAMALSPDQRRLYVVDQMNFRVVALDTRRWEIVDVVPVGRYPFGICCSPDGSTP